MFVHLFFSARQKVLTECLSIVGKVSKLRQYAVLPIMFCFLALLKHRWKLKNRSILFSMLKYRLVQRVTLEYRAGVLVAYPLP